LKKIDENAKLPKDLQSLNRGVIISFFISTLNEDLASLLELVASRPQERLETMRACKKNGFLTGVTFIPVLPYLSKELEQRTSEEI
jgi:DNA repair photolyase